MNEQGTAHWTKQPLANLIAEGDKINYGVVQPGDDLEEGVPLVRVGDFVSGEINLNNLKQISPEIDRKHRKSRLVGDEILVACVGSIGAIGLVDSSIAGANIARAVARIRCSDSVFRKYLYWYLRSPEPQRFFNKETRTVSQPTLNIREIEQTLIPLPPIAEQRRIAAILDRADAVRRKRQEAIALTEELLRSAFLEMFGDPITNPKDWQITTLETTFSRNPQIGTTKPAHADGEQIVVRVGEIGGQNVELNKCGRITLEGKELERFLCKPGDLLLARAIGSESHLGKASILQSTEQVIVFDSHVMRLRFNTDLLLPIFFLQWLKTDGGRTRFMREAGRTAVQFNVNATQISRVEIPLPPIKLQKKFVSFYTKTLRSIENYGSGYEACNNLFNSLLQRAFRGEL